MCVKVKFDMVILLKMARRAFILRSFALMPGVCRELVPRGVKHRGETH